MEENEIKYVWSASSWLMMFTKGPEEKYSWSRSFKTVSTGGGVDGGDVCSSGSGVGCLSLWNVVGRSSWCCSFFFCALSFFKFSCKKYNGLSSHFSNSSTNPFRLFSEFFFASCTDLSKNVRLGLPGCVG